MGIIGGGHEISDMAFLLEELEMFLKIAFLVVFWAKNNVFCTMI